MARKRERQTQLLVGISVLVFVVLGAVSLFIIGQSEGTWKTKTTIVTDFGTITGLRAGSPVQLAGKEIGKVKDLAFNIFEYKCDFASEDYGRYGEGRTDNCDPFLFCAPINFCADLEPWAARGLHQPCLGNDDCGADEICVTKEFRRRYSRVYWTGHDGVCARYGKEHTRVRATLEIEAEKLDLIRSDSRATVASNSLLGDRLVSITPGMREPIPPGGRILSTPSLYEDIELFRGRIEGLTEKVDTSLSGISNLFSELNDEQTIDNIKGTLANINETTRQIAEGEGLVGAMLNDPEFKKDFGITLRHVRDTAGGIDRFVERANGTLKKADDEIQPAIDDMRATLAKMRKVLEDLESPENKSLLAKLLRDGDGNVTQDFEKMLADMRQIMEKVNEGEGTVGKLVNDPKAHDDLVKLFQNVERNKVFKALIRHSMKLDDKQTSARPP